MFDVIVVGSGPAGVSASFPLVAAGLRVLMIDGGRENRVEPPAGQYLVERARARDQSRWMVGADFHALRQVSAVSPKLRAPTQAATFVDFSGANRVSGSNFALMGSLARGGLSNAWGCGVAALSPGELQAFPVDEGEMRASYATVSRRIGMSGAGPDDMKDYFGVDEWADQPVPLDDLHDGVMRKYSKARVGLREMGFLLGRSRVAALSTPRSGRNACDLSGMCLWGCHRGALYSSVSDLATLRDADNFTYRPGFIVDRFVTHDGYQEVIGHQGGMSEAIPGRRTVLAAGTLATTAIAMRSLGMTRPLAVQTSPTAAFLLWLPAQLGAGRRPGFGLGQLSFSLALEGGLSAFGSTFSSTGLPVAEFVRHLPLSRRYGADVLRTLLSSCILGNAFFPGSLSDNSATLLTDGTVHFQGGFATALDPALNEARVKLGKAFRRLGAWMLPGSFTPSAPGADIHYACSLPMLSDPGPGQCTAAGELFGAPGIFVADGASLSALSAKSHTLTIMANADRIGRGMAARLAG
ncbi:MULTISPECIES: FAD-dependent monooxygenase [Luteibacter]|uniref:FAD-dependent monooxygenase n=1 Tax=Luteibacter sp. dw_328 TaxID=2719796 RepID=UPI0007BEC95D|nr:MULTISPECIES: FAD-dependent monooxygenase [Luteibacter]